MLKIDISLNRVQNLFKKLLVGLKIKTIARDPEGATFEYQKNYFYLKSFSI